MVFPALLLVCEIQVVAWPQQSLLFSGKMIGVSSVGLASPEIVLGVTKAGRQKRKRRSHLRGSEIVGRSVLLEAMGLNVSLCSLQLSDIRVGALLSSLSCSSSSAFGQAK